MMDYDLRMDQEINLFESSSLKKVEYICNYIAHMKD